MSDIKKQMTYQLGRTHGWLKASEVQRMYALGKGHGRGTASPSPEIRNQVTEDYVVDFNRGFADGVRAYEDSLP